MRVREEARTSSLLRTPCSTSSSAILFSWRVKSAMLARCCGEITAGPEGSVIMSLPSGLDYVSFHC